MTTLDLATVAFMLDNNLFTAKAAEIVRRTLARQRQEELVGEDAAAIREMEIRCEAYIEING